MIARTISPPAAQLAELFGNYKAEWLRERIFDLFTQPSYFPDLENMRPCVLMGGRGTGKTTVLRSLSYEGKFALSAHSVDSIKNWNYYGFYYRVDTNRVTAFQGPELSSVAWTKLFGHYINLLLCGQVARFLDWYSLHLPDEPKLPANACERVAVTLCAGPSRSIPELLDQLDLARIKFEAYLNNLTEDNIPPLSLQGAAIDELISSICMLPQFSNKHFFFLIDEYENFIDEQQIIVNTLIKHSGAKHTFKIGVRELGWRKRATLNPNEQLISPADYVRINIAERMDGPLFESFAASICDQRMALLELDQGPIPTIQELLPGISEEEEARLLGVEKSIDASIAELSSLGRSSLLSGMSPLEIYFAISWAHANSQDLSTVLESRLADAKAWSDRYGNYKHALLFTIRRGKVGIRKYYAGWRTFVQLSRSNIRYLLELVDRTLALHNEQGNALGLPVDVRVQTFAAQSVGKKNVAELEGLSVFGAQLTKLVLGLGRVFQVLAMEPEGHAPEVNQIHISEKGHSPLELSELLNAAVMHLALVRDSGTKLADEADVKAYDYSLHPIFSPFFVFSYRKKRKISVSSEQIVGLVHNSKETIRDILKHNEASENAPLPEQLRLFEAYYGSAA